MTIDLKLTQIPRIVDIPSIEKIEDRVKQIFFEEAELQGVSYELLPSDPAYMQLMVVTKVLFLALTEVQDSARLSLFPFSGGARLNLIGRRFRQERSQIGNDASGNPLFDIDDEEFKERILTAFDENSTAGAKNSYIANAKRAPGGRTPEDVSPYPIQPSDGDRSNIGVALLFKENLSDPREAAVINEERNKNIETIAAFLNSDDVKPLGDVLKIFEATPKGYKVEAKLKISGGVSAAVVLGDALNSLKNYLESRRRCGLSVTRSGIIAALFAGDKGRFNVEDVELVHPEGDTVCEQGEYPKLNRKTVNNVQVDDIDIQEWRER